MIKRAYYFFRNQGFIKTTKKVLKKIKIKAVRLPNICREYFKRKKSIDFLKKKTNNKNIYVIIPCMDWYGSMFQRTHQMATVLSTMEKTIVFFVSDQFYHDNFCFFEQLSETLYLYSIRMTSSLNKILYGSTRITVIMTWTRHFDLSNKLRYDKLIYEYADELQLLYYYDSKMEEKHREMTRKADLTVATADKLYNQAFPYAKKLILNPNAADYNFFQTHRGCPVNPLIFDIIKQYSCVIGYYGALAKWFDYDLILEVATKRQNWLFILIGLDFDGTISIIKKANLPNVVYIEPRPYHELPSFVSGFDIQIIPFIVNDITESVSPVKLFEYMASQKPILSSDMPECRKYESVFRYFNAEDFEKKISHLMGNRDNLDYLALLDKEALENTWQARVNHILAELEG